MVALIFITLISGTCENAWNIVVDKQVFVEGCWVISRHFFFNLLTDMEKQVPISPFTDSYLYLSLLSCAMQLSLWF